MKVEAELLATRNCEVFEQLNLINALQRLGVAYHFEETIEEILQNIYETHCYDLEGKADLYHASLVFRIMRQYGFPITCEYQNEKTFDFASELNGDGLLQKLPLWWYRHGDAVAGSSSSTSLSDGKFHSNPNEYDRFSRQLQMWPRSSDWFGLDDDTISIAGTISAVVPSDILIIGEASSNISRNIDLRSKPLSRMGRILAAITGTKGDSGEWIVSVTHI
ncbi:hypothetical protein Ancab_001451 [Ancistrocladus abbreviatus]